MKLDLQPVSLALVGYGLSDGDLRHVSDSFGLPLAMLDRSSRRCGLANKPDAHSCIIALAVGRHPGVSTLAHFLQATARELADVLLDWARTPEAGLIAPHVKGSLGCARGARELSPLVSLSGVADFLSAWKAAQPDNRARRPKARAPAVGLLPDRNLLSADRSLADGCRATSY